MKEFLRKRIRKRLYNYRIDLNHPDENLPKNISSDCRVAVIGGGLAGIASAATLAERGFKVILFEKNEFLGGKLGSWVFKSNGEELRVSHGFHAFFRQYYNLRGFMKKIGAIQNLTPLEDYVIMFKSGEKIGFRDLDKTPGLNVIGLRKMGIYSWWFLLNPFAVGLVSLLKYDPDKTFKKFDKISFEDFAQSVRMPAKMKLVFSSFARAFFSDPERMAAAELMKGFHFYFLSNEYGLTYDVLNDDFGDSFVKYCESFIESYGGVIRKRTPVFELSSHPGGFSVNHEEFKYVVLCTDINSTRSLVNDSRSLSQYSRFYNNINSLANSGRYAVLRIWMNRMEDDHQMPFFVFTDRVRCLDSISLFHKIERESIEWSERNGGGIFELHCYSVPDDLIKREDVRNQLLSDFFYFFPEMGDAEVVHEYFQLRNDFPAFSSGLHETRPTILTEIEGLYLAGDWVKMNNCTMLMEAAFTSGVLSANEILKKEGLREEKLESVPGRGVLG